MSMGKDIGIVRVGKELGYGEGAREWGRIVLAKGGRRGKSGTVQWVRALMNLMDKHVHLILVLV